MVTWQHISGWKISRTVHASHRIIVNQTALLFIRVKPHYYSSGSNRVTVHSGQTMLLFIRVKPCYCSSAWSNRGLLTDDVAQSWASKLFLIRWPWFTPCIYKKGASPPNLISLNPFLDSIFCNSLSILYFLRILINSHFAPSSIMSG